MSPKRASEMSSDEFEDFVSEMFWHAREGGGEPLDMAPVGVTDLGRRTVTHGPWHPADCAVVFQKWHDGGLVELWSHRWGQPIRDGRRLDAAEVADLLGRPGDWDEGDDVAIPLVSVGASETGYATAQRQWHELVDQTDFDAWRT